MADPIDRKTAWVGPRPKRHAESPLVKDPERSQVRGVIGRKLAIQVRDEGIDAYRARQAEMKALAKRCVLSQKKKQKQKNQEWAKRRELVKRMKRNKT